MPVFRGSGDVSVSKELIRRLNENARRVRDMEELGRTLENKIYSLEERILDNQEELKKRFRKLEDEIKDLNIRLRKIENENDKIKRTLDRTVKKPELEEIEKYVKLMNPFEMNFVTKNEVKKMIRESK